MVAQPEASWAANFRGCPSVGTILRWLKRPLTSTEVTAILKAFLQCGDGDLSSHSRLFHGLPKVNCREQRRVLGRHSWVILDFDSFYSRDMSFGPVNALRRIIFIIKDNQFHPDASRSNYFGGDAENVIAPAGFSGSSTLSRVTMQPFTLDMHVDVDNPAVASPPDACLRAKDKNYDLVKEVSGVRPIQVESDAASAESLSSEDFQCVTEPRGLGPQPEVQDRPCKVRVLLKMQDDAHFHDILDGSATNCGRLIDERFQVVVTPEHWTYRCRVCFKGRRDGRM